MENICENCKQFTYHTFKYDSGEIQRLVSGDCHLHPVIVKKWHESFCGEFKPLRPKKN